LTLSLWEEAGFTSPLHSQWIVCDGACSWIIPRCCSCGKQFSQLPLCTALILLLEMALESIQSWFHSQQKASRESPSPGL
ncbi:unnamed protein product, partial [Bubo scandiacus]